MAAWAMADCRLGGSGGLGAGVGAAAWAPHRLEGDDGLDAPLPGGAG